MTHPTHPMDHLLDSVAACDVDDARKCVMRLQRATGPATAGPVTMPHDIGDADPLLLLALGQLLSAADAAAAAHATYQRALAAIDALLANAGDDDDDDDDGSIVATARVVGTMPTGGHLQVELIDGPHRGQRWAMLAGDGPAPDGDFLVHYNPADQFVQPEVGDDD